MGHITVPDWPNSHDCGYSLSSNALQESSGQCPAPPADRCKTQEYMHTDRYDALNTTSILPKTGKMLCQTVIVEWLKMTAAHLQWWVPRCLGVDNQQIHVWRHPGQHQDVRFVVTRPQDLVPLLFHHYHKSCRNCVKIFKLHGMDYHRTQLGALAIGNTVTRLYTETLPPYICIYIYLHFTTTTKLAFHWITMNDPLSKFFFLLVSLSSFHGMSHIVCIILTCII